MDYQEAAIPHNEEARLQELHSLKLLDAQTDARLSRYTRLASEFFDIPVALVSLIDRDAQHFKAVYGPLDATGTPRGQSFCGHAVANDQPLLIPDATADDRFAGNPLVIGEPHIRFYAGVPLHGPTGHALGALCLIDFEPRRFSQRDLRLLEHIAGLVEHDILHYREVERLREQVSHDAFRDVVTKLPNQNLIGDRLAQAVRSNRRADRPVLVALVNIVGFGAFNEAYGRGVGDELLRCVAERLGDAVPEDASVGRWRDDHFLIVMPLRSGGDAEAFAQAWLADLQPPVELHGRLYPLRFRIGISRFPSDSDDPETLIQQATAAMRTNTHLAGGSSYSVFDSGSAAHRVRRVDLYERLGRALAENQLSLNYQPQVDTRSEQLTGVEALLRWTEPDLGQISPAEFIPLAEETGLILEIGQFVLHQACRQAMEWRRRGVADVPVSVNLTARQLHEPDLVEHIEHVLLKTGLPSSRLVLEVTEGSLIRDVERVARHMRALQALGVRVAIDDFGTGYSSFAYLAQLPLDCLKIDRSFVRAIGTTDGADKVVTGLIELAHALSLEVVAEGVETAEQVAFLRRQACDHLQGFYYSVPLPAAGLAAFARNAGRSLPLS